jgi:hypothetical protein
MGDDVHHHIASFSCPLDGSAMIVLFEKLASESFLMRKVVILMYLYSLRIHWFELLHRVEFGPIPWHH